MTADRCNVLLTREPLGLERTALSPRAGAVVEFLGVVRGLEDGEPIAGLEYDAHAEMAGHQLRKLAAEACGRFEIETLRLHHRIGRVPVAEPSLFVSVAAAHRGEAFAACQWVIDRLKETVPIWKEAVASAESRLGPMKPATTP